MLSICSTGSNPVTDITQWMLGATGHYFIKILAEKSAVAEKANRNPVNYSKVKQNKREYIVIPNFKSIVQSYWMQFCSPYFKDMVDMKGRAEQGIEKLLFKDV